MIADLKPYPAMKDSGVPWLGEMPEHWEVQRLGSSVQGCINGVWGSEPNGRDDLPCVRVADFDRLRLRVRMSDPTLRAVAYSERNRRLLKTGDLLLEKSGGGESQPVGVAILYDHHATAVCSNFVARMPVSAGFDSAYLTYLHSHLYAIRLNVRSIKQTTGIQNLDSRSYLDEPVAFPPLPEQAAIVRFLDYADRRIRRYIRAKQKLIKLLEQQKQAIVHRAVTRGLDPNVRLKPSGVEWLGDVPEHWKVRRLHQITDPERPVMYGIVLLGPDVDEGVYIVKGGNCEPGKLRPELLSRTTFQIESRYGRSRLRENDIVFAIRGGVGAAELVPPELAGANLTQDAARIAPGEGIDSGWLLHAVSAPIFREHVTSQVVGATVRGINIRSLKRIELVVPPYAEQKQIAEHIADATGDISAALDRARQEIALLREYRTRLIADVVTGKFDVREAAARLPNEPDEFDPIDEADVLADAEDAADDDLDAMPEEAEA